MKLIIDIPEEDYKIILCSDGRPFLPSYKWIKWIKNGISLNKIRAEIEEHVKINQNLNVDRARALCWCLDVIDKYSGESEEV